MRRGGNDGVGMALPFCLFGQISIVLWGQPAGGISNVKLEHSFPRVDARQWDIDTFLEPRGRGIQRTDHRKILPYLPSLDRVVQSPRNVRGSKHKYTSVVVTNSVHLNQKLRLDASRTLGFALTTGPGEGIDFVDKDDGRFIFSRHLE